MSRTLLFIGRYPEIVEEFRRMLLEKDVEIEVAENGVDAVNLLKQKSYQVVVTALAFEGVNGEQIVTYVNITYPDTICMIYTSAISAAQLDFYLNKRNVFRVFLRPMNFRKEFMQALEEAYEYYDMKIQERENEKKKEKIFAGNQEAVTGVEKLLLQQKNGWDSLEQFSEKLLYYSINREKKDEVSSKQSCLQEERRVVKQMCKNPEQENISRLQLQIKNM